MDGNSLNFKNTEKFVEEEFNNSIISNLCEYIKIPNLSPNYDTEWLSNGNQEKAATFLLDYVLKQNIKGLKAEIIQDKEKTPIIFIEVESNGNSKANHFLYGHFDKQPYFGEWSDGLHPLKPEIRGDLLYGRGGADDGYAIFSCLAAVKANQTQGKVHGRLIILIEGSEESGSPHLMDYVAKLKDRIGEPDLVFCLDSGCLTYDTLWITSSLRGNIVVDISVETMTEGVHSGFGGIAPDTLMILRNILDRIEDSKTGVMDKDFHVDIPKERLEELKKVSDFTGNEIFKKINFLNGVQPLNKDPYETLLNVTWRPCMTIAGASGFPKHSDAGNVLRAKTDVRLTMRVPPSKNAEEAKNLLVKKITENPPYGAKIEIGKSRAGTGFNAKSYSDKLKKHINDLSYEAFGKEVLYFGEGGSIPFINQLATIFPNCEFVILGVLGPGSNAHSINESLHIPYCKKITSIVAHLLSDMAL